MIPESIIAPENVKQSIDWALGHIGTIEDPLGSNRGPELDEWCKEAGSPLGSYWCAIALWKSRKAGGLWVPDRDVASCDEWVYQALRANKVISQAVPGAAVIYTNGEKLTDGRYAGQLDADHCGLVERVTPKRLSIEGNTTLGKYDRNGIVMTLKEVNSERVYFYIAP